MSPVTQLYVAHVVLVYMAYLFNYFFVFLVLLFFLICKNVFVENICLKIRHYNEKHREKNLRDEKLIVFPLINLRVSVACLSRVINFAILGFRL